MILLLFNDSDAILNLNNIDAFSEDVNMLSYKEMKTCLIDQDFCGVRNDSLDNKNHILQLEQSLAGAFIGEYYASDNNEYQFDRDSIVVYSWDDFNDYLIGKWTFKGDTIKMKFFKAIGKRGVGDVLSPPEGIPANYIDVYSEYVGYVESSTNSDYLVWSDIKKSLTSEENDSYKLIDYNENLDLSSYNKSVNGVFGVASFRLLKSNDLDNYSKSDLRLMRNEIFARYGYVFKNKELRDYFLEQDWYVAKNCNVDKYFSKIERENIILIIDYENKKLDDN